MRIPSASDVLPQQREYVQEVTRSIGPNSLFGNLPLELVEMIEDYVDSTMTREEAEDYRILLMNERTIFVDESTSQYFGQMFNMWCANITQITFTDYLDLNIIVNIDP